MDSHFSNLPLLEYLHDIGLYHVNIQENRKGLPNKVENEKKKV